MFNGVSPESAQDKLNKYLLSEGLHALPTLQHVWEYSKWADVYKML